ncbi:citrate/2-methylcitrate synthase [Streptomyces sp. NPDC004561]
MGTAGLDRAGASRTRFDRCAPCPRPGRGHISYRAVVQRHHGHQRSGGAARYIASGNPQFVPAVAGGVLAAGSNTVSPEHFDPLLRCAEEIRERDACYFDEAAATVVQEYMAAERRVPGFGHSAHKSSDFRADILFDAADKAGLTDKASLTGESVLRLRAIP